MRGLKLTCVFVLLMAAHASAGRSNSTRETSRRKSPLKNRMKQAAYEAAKKEMEENFASLFDKQHQLAVHRQAVCRQKYKAEGGFYDSYVGKCRSCGLGCVAQDNECQVYCEGFIERKKIMKAYRNLSIELHYLKAGKADKNQFSYVYGFIGSSIILSLIALFVGIWNSCHKQKTIYSGVHPNGDMEV